MNKKIQWDENKCFRFCMRRDSIRAEVEATFRRIKTDYIDLYQIHTANPEEEIEEGWHCISPPQLAIAWVLRQKDLTAAIVGARCVDHVAEIVRAGELVMAKENLLESEAILADHRAKRRELNTPYLARVILRSLNSFLTVLFHRMRSVRSYGYGSEGA